MKTFYYTKADLIEFSTTLSTNQVTNDTAYSGMNKYVLYQDTGLTKIVGEIFYTATVYTCTDKSIAYNPYVLTVFFTDKKNITATGAHDDSKDIFFPIGIVERSTVTDQTGFDRKIKYIEVTALDENVRKLSLIGCRHRASSKRGPPP